MRNILYAQLFFILIIAFVTSTKSYAFNVAKHISNVNGLTNNSGSVFWKMQNIRSGLGHGMD